MKESHYHFPHREWEVYVLVPRRQDPGSVEASPTQQSARLTVPAHLAYGYFESLLLKKKGKQPLLHARARWRRQKIPRARSRGSVAQLQHANGVETP